MEFQVFGYLWSLSTPALGDAQLLLGFALQSMSSIHAFDVGKASYACSLILLSRMLIEKLLRYSWESSRSCLQYVLEKATSLMH